MGYTTLQYGLQNPDVYSVAGAQRLFFLASEDIRSYEVVNDDTVNKINLLPQKKYYLLDGVDSISYNLTTTSTKAGKLYQIDVSFSVANQTGIKNALFDNLADMKVVVILQENNFYWWCLGHEQPLQVVSNEAKIDDDSNGYTIKLSTKQRELPYHFSADWIAGVGSLPFADTIDPQFGTITPTVISQPVIPKIPVISLPTIPVSSNVIVNPANNYVLVNSLEYALVAGGRTIYLPTSPTEGQQHVIKDLNSSANVLPITIDGNGRAIDSDTAIQINTKDGAVSLFYAANKWNTHTFIN